MRARALLALLLYFATVAVAADGPLDPWRSGKLDVKFLGLGRECGPVLRLTVSNTGAQKQAFQFPTLLILEPSDSHYAPVVVERGAAWEINAKAHLDYQVQGYSLDHSKEMPGKRTAARYVPSLGGERYAKVQQALKKTLVFEKKVGFRPVLLSKETHRVLVIQRALWIAQGGKNPSTAKALVADLRRSFEGAGKKPSQKAIEGIAASVWRDVEKVYQTLAES